MREKFNPADFVGKTVIFRCAPLPNEKKPEPLRQAEILNYPDQYGRIHMKIENGRLWALDPGDIEMMKFKEDKSRDSHD